MTLACPKPVPPAGPRSLSPGMVFAGFIAAALLCGGCTTFKASQLPPDALRSGIRSGALIAAGDDISIVTAGGTEYLLTVSAVDAVMVRGQSPNQSAVAIPIDEILALRKREVEPVRTTFAALGGSLAAALFLLILDLFDKV